MIWFIRWLNNFCEILDKQQYSLLRKVNMTSSSGGSSQPKKVILLQRNMKPNNKHEFVREAAALLAVINDGND